MMSVKNVQIRTILSGLMAASLLAANVQANRVDNSLAGDDPRQCGATSSLFLSLGDAYFDVADIHTTAVASAEEIEQNELLSRLTDVRFSEGWGYRVHCIGSANGVHARLLTVSLEDIEARQTRYPDLESAISVTAYEYDGPSRRLTREIVTIPTRPEDLQRLDGQKLVSSSRHRQATRIGSYLKETIINATLENNMVTIDQSVYVNGTLAQWHTWHLTY